MPVFRNLIAGAAATLAPAVVLAASASTAQAQATLSGGVTASVSQQQFIDPNAYAIDLGVAQSTGWVTTMPMSLSYGNTNLNITFGGSAGVYSGSTFNVASAPPLGTNFFLSRTTGTVTFDFSSVQRSLGLYWGTPGPTNLLQFYNDNQLISSVTGAQMDPWIRDSGSPIRVGNVAVGAFAQFNFAELGFNRVVATNTNNNFEFAAVTFSNTAPDVVPIPLGGVGGIIALLGMFALRRGYGGHLPQRLLAFASGGRRQQVQRFA
jgi:hypothetical protein